MLVCRKCGSGNPLGKVFCQVCGSRLDASMMNAPGGGRGHGADGFGMRRRLPIGRWLAVIVLLTLIGGAGLALWPATVPEPRGVTRDGAMRVSRQLQALAGLRADQSVRVSLAESDVNAYLLFVRRGEFHLKRLQVALVPGEGRVFLENDASSIHVGSWHARITMKLVVIAINGRAVVRGVTLGHLPLVGPLKSAALARLSDAWAGSLEAELMSHVREISFENDRLSLSVGK